MNTLKAYQHWQTHIDAEQILWLSFDRADVHVNTINHAVLAELNHILDHVPEAVCGLVIRSGKKTGMMGADIHEFGAFTTTEEVMHMVKTGQNTYLKLAELHMPTVMLIEGYCLGGALEMALACHYRIALQDPKTQIGLPESKLGILPTWGGATRLPMLIGVTDAMEMMLKGKILNAHMAKKLGVVDLCVPLRQFERAAHAYVQQPPLRHKPALFQRLLAHKIVRPWFGQMLLDKLKKMHVLEAHYPAPYAIVKQWMKSNDKIAQGHAHELQAMNELFISPTAKNLIHLFFLREKLKNQASGVCCAFTHVHVIGSGTMGMGIATLCAAKGLRVSLQDENKTQLAKAIQHAYQYLQIQIKEKARLQFILDNFIPDENGELISQADVVIEAVYENLELKQNVFQEIMRKAKPEALLATNTSSIMLEKISSTLANPERLVGVHFFNPVEKMPLVEIITATANTESVRLKALAFANRLGLVPLPVKSYPGFLVNRLLMPYVLEAVTMLQEGIEANVIDKAAMDFGMPVGPIELADRVGLDICYAVAKILLPQEEDIPALLKEKITQGRLGVKSQRGFYRYKGTKKISTKTKKSQKQNTLNQDELRDRLIYVMLLEAAHCLQEKIVADGDAIDAGTVFGAGFAPFRGGLWTYAKSLGQNKLSERLRELASRYGERFAVAINWDEIL